MCDISQASKAIIVEWKDIDRWRVNSNLKSTWEWPGKDIKKISYALSRRIERVDKEGLNASNASLISISFNGDVTPRKKNTLIKGTLYYAHAGDIVYSKIDVRNGAIGVVPDSIPLALVTSEYPVYSIKEDIAYSEYIQILFRTTHFRKIINSIISGHSGRKRVNPEVIENTYVPIPSLHLQKRIVEYWYKKEKINAALLSKIQSLHEINEKLLLNQLNLSLLEKNKKYGAQVYEWVDLERWDTMFYRSDFVALEKQLSSIQSLPLGSILHFTSRSWSERDFPTGRFRYIQISDVSMNSGVSNHIEIPVKKAPSRATTLIKKGDILLSKTRPYLGAFTIVPEEYDSCVCSSGFALADRVVHEGYDKEYILLFLKSKAGLLQMERRMTGGLYPAIVQDELEKIRIPLVPMSIQINIVSRYSEAQEEILKDRLNSEFRIKQITSDVNDMIKGIKKIED